MKNYVCVLVLAVTLFGLAATARAKLSFVPHETESNALSLTMKVSQ